MKTDGKISQLYHFPTACSSVTQAAMERIGIPYELILVDLATGVQNKNAYKNINPGKKVPALLLEGQLLTENAAILFSLNALYKNSLLESADPSQWQKFLRDLVWCSATLHPMVRQIRAPFRYTDGDPEPVRANGLKQFAEVILQLEERLSKGWWYGDSWSIIDTYLRWILGVAATGMSLDNFPGIQAHCEKIDARIENVRARKREARAIENNQWLK